MVLAFRASVFRAALVVVLLSALPQATAVPSRLSGTVVAGGEPVQDAVIWLEAPGAPRRAAPGEAVLNQRDVQFAPRVLAVQVGATVKFPNSDRVFHNVFSYHDGTKFDLGLYPVGAVKHVPFKQPGLSRVYCNIHPQMSAYVMVVDTPYFAVSDRSGRFTIADVPRGTYRYHAWRPGGTILTDEIDTGADAPFIVRWP
jgi:plastocyanin